MGNGSVEVEFYLAGSFCPCKSIVAGCWKVEI